MSSTAIQQGRHPPAMTTRSVRTFFALTFGISWGMVALLMAFPDQTQAIFGEMGYTNPAFILIVYTPGIVGVLMVWRHYGLTGLRGFLRRLTLWRMSMRWWLLLALGMPAVFYLAATLKGTITDPFPFSPWYQVLPALIPALFIGPVEELGWRGVALPLLQRRFAPLWAGLILGVVAALWHTPAFLVSGTKQSAWSYGPFFLGVVAISVILTAMFNASGGSLLVAVLFHFQMNGPAWPDAQPWDTLIFVIVAAIIVILNRAAMLTPDRAATAVLMADDESVTQRPNAPVGSPAWTPVA